MNTAEGAVVVTLPRSYLCEVRARGVGAQQFALHVLLDALDHAVLVQEVYLVLRGVDVHIYVLRGDLQAATGRLKKSDSSLIFCKGRE